MMVGQSYNAFAPKLHVNSQESKSLTISIVSTYCATLKKK